MKILNVNHIMDPVTGGGTAERTFQMSQHLINHGEECTILTLVGGQQKRVLKGGQFIVLPIVSLRFLIPKYLFKGMAKPVKEADVIHLMGHWTLLNVMVYVLAKIYNKPYVFCPAGSLPIFGRSKWLKKIYNLVIGKSIVQNAGKCIAITEIEKMHFHDYGVDPSRVSLIPNSIAIPQMPPLNENQFIEKFSVGNKPFILFLGQLSYIKGPDLLVSAFCSIMDKISEYDLVVVGPDVNMLAVLKELVEKNKAQDRVHFVGYLGGLDKFQAYQAATILAIPSRQEAMSLVVLEAAAVGTPAVFTDQCGLDKFAEAGCGWIVPATIEGLAQGLTTALSDVSAIRAMNAKVSDYVQKNYSWDQAVKTFQKMYQELTRKK